MPQYGWTPSPAALPLWPHQRAAIALVQRVAEHPEGGAGLVRMPTGTGKSGVVAVAAHAFEDADVLVLAPWDALVEQLRSDIEERFWSRLPAEPPGDVAT